MTYPVWFILTVVLSGIALIALSIARGFDVRFKGWGVDFSATKSKPEQLEI